jgi:hypothetical protein
VRNANIARSSTTPGPRVTPDQVFGRDRQPPWKEIMRMKTFKRLARLELARLKLVNPGQRQHRDLTLGFLLITVKERHQAGLRVE